MDPRCSCPLPEQASLPPPVPVLQLLLFRCFVDRSQYLRDHFSDPRDKEILAARMSFLHPVKISSASLLKSAAILVMILFTEISLPGLKGIGELHLTTFWGIPVFLFLLQLLYTEE
jgi:hypothetical protein